MRRHFFESVENSGDPGRQRTDQTRHFREAGRSVCERECRSGVAGPIIYGTCTRRVAQFARGSAGPAGRVAQFARGSVGPGSPDLLFTALPRGRCLSLREAVPALGPRPHYLRHFGEGPAGVANGPRKHATFATRGGISPIVLRIRRALIASGTIKYVTFAKRGATFPIALRIPGENDTIPR